MNVNFPRRLSDGYEWVWCRQGVRDYQNAYERQQDEAGRVFYTVGGSPLLTGNADDTDVMVTDRGNISVTPLQLDKTDFSALP